MSWRLQAALEQRMAEVEAEVESLRAESAKSVHASASLLIKTKGIVFD